MKAPQAPHLDERRTEKFAAEFRERAQAWIPGWALADGERDFGRALLAIAARFSSEVAERLDLAGDKMRRGFLDWLGVRGEAARPARLPVVFKLADTAPEAVLASAPVQMQAEAAGTPVMFETEKDVCIVPGQLQVVIGVDADHDAFYLPPPEINDLKPAEPLPQQWQLKSFAAAGATRLQLDPEAGLGADMIIAAGSAQYRITQPDGGIVTIDPPLDVGLPELTPVTKVTTFAPFDTAARNRQKHALYLGDTDLLNIEAGVTLDVVGAGALTSRVKWQYWGKTDPSDEVGWQPLTPDAQRQQTTNDAVALTKPKGTIEQHKIGGKDSRWIRAYTTHVEGAEPLLRVEALALRVLSKNETPPMPDALANTTPLVLGNVFFPLGKEPRQFDAFYLGSQEAFSKAGATAKLLFEMADRTFSTLAAVQAGTFTNQVLAGVATDKALHLLSLDPTTGALGKFHDRDPLQPPRPGYQGDAEAGNAVALDPRPWRLPVWSEPDPPPYAALAGFLVGASAGDTIWIWHELSNDPQNSGWKNFGKLPPASSTTNPTVDGLVYLAGTPPLLAALRGGELYICSWPDGSQWAPAATLNGTDKITLTSIVPVLVVDSSGRLVTSTTEGMLGIDDKGSLFLMATTGACTPVTPVPANVKFDTRIRPVAIKSATELNVAAVTDSDPPNLVAIKVTTSAQQITLDGMKVLAALEVAPIGTTFHVLAPVSDSGGKRLITWAPFSASPADYVFKSPALGGGLMEGAPVAIGNFIVVPGARADILVSNFDLARRRVEQAPVEIGIVVPASVPRLAAGDRIVRSDGNVPAAPVSRLITQAGLSKDGEFFYPLASDFPAGTTGLDAYAASAKLAGRFAAPNQLTLTTDDVQTETGSWLLIDDQFFTVDAIDKTASPWVATISTPTGGPVPTNLSGVYVRPSSTGGHIAPFMRLDPATNGNWNASLLTRTKLIFQATKPREQVGQAFQLSDDNKKPAVVVLDMEFTRPPKDPATFVVDGAFDEWQRDTGDTATNPELSWEYWNGKGWWKLTVSPDETQNLKMTGVVQFTIPADIASSDWAGKTNFWIRARLVGGDYGREKVTARTKTLPDGSTEQTIERSSEGIRAPQVLSLLISYSVHNAVRPTYVLVQDSGSIRDQSAANQTGGAIVEAFVPLGETLRRLSNTAAALQASTDCPPECNDQPGQPTPVQTPTSTEPAPVSPVAGGRALFIGLSKAPLGANVNVLLLVEERQLAGFAPLTIEALVANRFDPVVTEDTTRALGETGLLSMTFTVPPTLSELFGQTLTWLRLAPKASANSADWNPSLRGAYLNAVWAKATETLTREVLGSSDGAPGMTVCLARPPVLKDTLELRVKEPLGDEERSALRKPDKSSVLNDVDQLPGDWVRWEQVVDPDDEPAEKRVYALDETKGEIRFGDGLHGRIPPIGRDSIVAFTYKRTESAKSKNDPVPGNLITARTTLNLVSPVATVESVTAANQAAGGAPPEDDVRVLRFGYARLWHRDRAVTLRDLEDLALESSPDIAQVLALARPDHVRLAVVMRGENPRPNAAQRRELYRFLLAKAPSALGAASALRIVGPDIRWLHLNLTLRVASLDNAAALEESVNKRLIGFFDTATGGVDQDGWALGVSPTEEDIAFALLDTPYLESIEGVTLREMTPEGSYRPWPDTLKPTELAMLAKDPIWIQFEHDVVAV